MLTPETLAHLRAEAAEDGATMILCSTLAELLRAYDEHAEARAAWGLTPPAAPGEDRPCPTSPAS